ncbi:MAG: FAD-dependent oxidoreductase [Acidimicrobiales bacterium]
MEERWDVVVVGGGLAGLAAARTVATAGARVLVVEAHDLGGRARTSTHDGFRFNLGPRALYLGGAGHQVLRDFGIQTRGGPPHTDRAHGLLKGELVRLPGTARSLLTTSLLGSRGKLAIARLLARLPKLEPRHYAHQTARAWLDKLRLPLDAEALVLTLARVATYTHAPDLVSADVVISQLQLALGAGVRYLDGGWQTLVDALATGLTIEAAIVKAIESSDDDVVVHTDGGPVRARAAVLAVNSPHAASGLLIDHPGFDVGPAVEAVCLDLGLRRPPDPPVVIGVDAPLYLSMHCPPADLAPPGSVVVHALRYLAPTESTTVHDDHHDLNTVVSAAGITDADIVTRRFLRRMTVTSMLPTADRGGLPGRPGPVIAEHPGVFVAGDWVGPVGMLADASLASAVTAARLAIERIQK